MVASAGTIIKDWNIGYWQGDYIYLLKNGDKFGFTVIGYGSCSGCDALEGCGSQEEVDELKKSVVDSILWSTADEIEKYITNEEANRWYFHEDEWETVQAELIQELKRETK
jgi:hypothetical protein